MALLFSDGMFLECSPGRLKGYAALFTNGTSYSTFAASGGNGATPGRAARSYYQSFSGWGPGPAYSMGRSMPFVGAQTTIGFAFYSTGNGSSGQGGLMALSINNPFLNSTLGSAPNARADEIALVGYYIDGALFRLEIRRNNVLVANLGTYSNNQWYYAEIQCTWGAAGRVVVRVDGDTKYDSGAGAVAFAAPTSVQHWIAPSYGGSFWTVRISDLLVMDNAGAEFNGFQGDVLVETLQTVADGTHLGWVPAIGVGAVTNVQRVSGSAYIYGTNMGGFSVGDSVTSAGLAVAALNGTFVVTAASSGQVVWADAGATISYQSSGGTVTDNTAPATHEQTVDDSGGFHNGDGDYITTAVVGAIDTFTMEDLSSPAASPVLAVRPWVVARKESAAAMSIAAVVRTASTNTGPAVDLPNTLAYTVLTDLFTTDPATGLAWTRAAVNGMEIGAKKVS